MSAHPGGTGRELTWFGQPRGLTILFLTEMWEQFSYYGMRALLVYYMTRQLLLGQKKAAQAGEERANGLWLVGFFAIFTLGELYILPTGLGLFARLAPAGFAATTVAAWFLAIFTGSLSAGVVGILWSSIRHAEFFGILALLALAAAGMLLALDRTTRRVEAVHARCHRLTPP